MKLETTFTVIARCNVFNINDKNDTSNHKEDIEIRFDLEDAENFLFRFSPVSFILDGFKVVCKYTHSFMLQSICLIKGNEGYIITNLGQVYRDVLEGYLQIRTLDKITDIMTFDFKAGIDIQESADVEDEFPDEE